MMVAQPAEKGFDVDRPHDFAGRGPDTPILSTLT